MTRMQLRLPWQTPETSSSRTVTVEGRTFDVEIARHRRARRYVLRMRPDGGLRLTVPRGSSISGGLLFAYKQSAWIGREWLRQQGRAAPLRNGSPIWYRGEQEPVRLEADVAVFGTARVACRAGDDGKAVIEKWLRAEAARTLPGRCLELAAQHGFTVARVSVRNQRSRWGACSPGGTITLNWRLIQMPDTVSDYVLLHELAHLRQANHSRRFWREVESICPWWRDAERWLRKHGREIL
jgi:predicted metal-dependent hydrolase